MSHYSFDVDTFFELPFPVQGKTLDISADVCTVVALMVTMAIILQLSQGASAPVEEESCPAYDSHGARHGGAT